MIVSVAHFSLEHTVVFVLYVLFIVLLKLKQRSIFKEKNNNWIENNFSRL